MKTVHSKVTTSRPADEVYAYLADFANQAEWRFDVLSSELSSGEPGVVGARYRQRVKQGGREVDSNVELTRAERPSEVAFRTVDHGPVTVTGTWRIQPEGTDQTAVVADIELTTHGAMRLIEPLMGRQFRKTGERYEQALSERLNP